MTCELVNINLKEIKSKKSRNKSEASRPVKLPSIKVETENELLLKSKLNNSISKKRRMSRVKTMNVKSPVKIMDLTDKVFKDIPKFVSQISVVTPKLKSKLLVNGDSSASDELCRNVGRNNRTLKKNRVVSGAMKRSPLAVMRKELENSLEYIKEYRNKKDKDSFNRAISPWVYQGSTKYSIFV